jgi:hypothetical protein
MRRIDIDEQPEFHFRIVRDGNFYTFFLAKKGTAFTQIGKLTSDAVGTSANIYFRTGGDRNIAWIDYIMFE